MVLLSKKCSCVRSLSLFRLCSYSFEELFLCKINQAKSTRRFAMVAQGYEEAISALNGLQSNAATIQNIRLHGDSSRTQLPDTIKFLGRAGISLDALDRLSVIHVTGTKGKGSTCAFTERILRQYGYKTGLYTSPHLVSVTERIRINGQPIHRDEYTKHFWRVYNALYCKRENSNDMPAYFKFLTVLAMKIFLEEQVDVAVLEVGIGGEFDCTNVVRNPVVCGITTLDLDHTSLLGSTLESIAWHKAGIIKAGAGVYTVQGHQPQALKVLEERAAQKQCKVLVCPALSQYSCGVPVRLGLAGRVQLSNASLALQLARYWINNSNGKDSQGGRLLASVPPAPVPKGDGRFAPAFVLTDQETRALRDVVWPGRSQVFPMNEKFTFFLDGAHTSQSMEACAQWFLDASTARLPAHGHARCVRVLWFNATGDRDTQTLLRRLLCCRFNLALFTTNTVSQDPKFADQINLTVSGRSVLLRCQTHLETWQYLTAAHDPPLSHKPQGHDQECAERHWKERMSRSSALEHPDTESKAKTLDRVNSSISSSCPERSSTDSICAHKLVSEEFSIVGKDGVKTVAQDDDRSLVGQLGSESCSSSSTLPSVKSKPVSTASSDFKMEGERSCQSSALPNSAFSSESNIDDGSLSVKTSPKRRSNVLQENVMSSREISARDRFPGRASAKESKRDHRPDFGESDRLSSRQSEVSVSKEDLPAELVSNASASVERQACRSASLPLDSRDRSLMRQTQSASLDRTHMLQLVSADDSSDSTSNVAVVIPYIQDALQWLRCSRCDTQQRYEDSENFTGKLAQDSSVQEALVEADQVHVLVTGSLHLVGGVLAVLDPSFTDSVPQRRPANLRRVFYSSPGTP